MAKGWSVAHSRPYVWASRGSGAFAGDQEVVALPSRLLGRRHPAAQQHADPGFFQVLCADAEPYDEFFGSQYVDIESYPRKV